MTDDAVDETDEDRTDDAGGPLGGLDPRTRAVVIGAAVAQVLLVLATQRDISTQAEDRLRGPRWLWHAIATTPLGVIVYGAIGTKADKPPFPSLPAPRVEVEG